MVYQTDIELIEKEFNEIEQNKAWDALYMKVKVEGTYDSSCSIARSTMNRMLNRYRDVLPYNHSRIVLQDTSVDYINASLVEVENIGRKYILTQGPLSSTTPHFWLMIWQQKTKGVIMLNKTIEKDLVKCDQYWPLGESRGGKSVVEHKSVNLNVELLKEVSHSHYKYRSFKLSNTKTGENREVLHFHYTTWPDFGVPNSPASFLEFLNVVRNSNCLEPQHGPAVIHCSAGIGRSGTFCLVDSILKMLSDGLCNEKAGKVLEVLVDLRKYRMGLIQTADQLKFSYEAIVYGAKQIDNIYVKDPTMESSSEEVSLDEPPPPPPRLASLTGRSLPWQPISDSGGDTDSDEDDQSLDDHEYPEAMGIYQRSCDQALNNDSLDKSLLEEPLMSSASSSDSSLHNIPYVSEETAEISEVKNARRRLHYQRLAATTDKIHEIKEKTGKAESWRQTKKFLFSGVSVCSVLLFLGIGTAYLYRQISA